MLKSRFELLRSIFFVDTPFYLMGVAHVRMINNWLIGNGELMIYSVVNSVIYVGLLYVFIYV